MWAALPVEPPTPWPPRAISTTNTPSPRRRSMVVRSAPNSHQMGGTLQSDELPHRNAAKSKTETNLPPEMKESEEQERQLRGSDILMALQRATARKSLKKNKQKNRINSARENQGGISFLSNSKPLCVKPEWVNRLLELERRLEELVRG